MRDQVTRAARPRGGFPASLPAFAALLGAARQSARMASRAAVRAGRKQRKDGAMARRWPIIVGGMLVGSAAVGAYAAGKRRSARANADAVVAIVEDAEGIVDPAMMGVTSDSAPSMMDSMAADRSGYDGVTSAAERALRKDRDGTGLMPQSGF